MLQFGLLKYINCYVEFGERFDEKKIMIDLLYVTCYNLIMRCRRKEVAIWEII